jgi:hypothetical protein
VSTHSGVMTSDEADAEAQAEARARAALLGAGWKLRSGQNGVLIAEYVTRKLYSYSVVELAERARVWRSLDNPNPTN